MVIGQWVVAIVTDKLDAEINAEIEIIRGNSDEEQSESSETLLWAEGYIAARHPCVGTMEDGFGYYIYTEKDTLLTFHFLEGVFNIPRDRDNDFDRMSIADRKSKYRIRFSYEITPEDKLVYPLCNGLVDLSKHHNAIQIIIKSATKID
jgi:hypothetical protein